MPAIESYVSARIDKSTKKRAAVVLDEMGLSISDAIRLLMIRVADEQRLPFGIKVPNKAMLKAITELEDKKVASFVNVDALMADLDADD